MAQTTDQTSPIAIDLSHHNTVSSFTSVASAGVIAVIHKATQGTSFVDEDYARRRKDALDAGLAFISYHFLEPGNVDQQIDHYLTVAQPAFGERVVIDHENEQGQPAPTLDDLCDAVRALLAADPSLQITVYSGHTIREQIGEYDTITLLADNTSLWISHYTDDPAPDWPQATWPAWSLWQYTDQGSVPGISGDCDLNRFNGADANAALWFAPATEQPQPAPAQKPVVVAITAPPDANLIVMINGDEVRL